MLPIASSQPHGCAIYHLLAHASNLCISSMHVVLDNTLLTMEIRVLANTINLLSNNSGVMW